MRITSSTAAGSARRVGAAKRSATDGGNGSGGGEPSSRRLGVGEDRRERLGRDDAELELLAAAPEGLVRVVEDPLHHVALAAEEEVRDLGLLLEDRPQELRQLRVELDDLLELVEDQDRGALPLGRDLCDELEQPLERRVDVLGPVTGAEAER